MISATIVRTATANHGLALAPPCTARIGAARMHEPTRPSALLSYAVCMCASESEYIHSPMHWVRWVAEILKICAQSTSLHLRLVLTDTGNTYIAIVLHIDL